jgi:hypothetical protein
MNLRLALRLCVWAASAFITAMSQVSAAPVPSVAAAPVVVMAPAR